MPVIRRFISSQWPALLLACSLSRARSLVLAPRARMRRGAVCSTTTGARKPAALSEIQSAPAKRERWESPSDYSPAPYFSGNLSRARRAPSRRISKFSMIDSMRRGAPAARWPKQNKAPPTTGERKKVVVRVRVFASRVFAGRSRSRGSRFIYRHKRCWRVPNDRPRSLYARSFRAPVNGVSVPSCVTPG